MRSFLLLVLEAPLLAFGGEAVDALGVIEPFPAGSMLTGLLANALGWQRHHRDALAGLQQRLHYAARIDREGRRLTDFQTAQLGGGDIGWTTRGAPEGRAGGAATYNAPHIRRRDYDADKRVVVALTLDPADEAPTLHDLAAALDEPARPLFIGRKPCLPTGRICAGIVEAATLLDALALLPPSDNDRAGPQAARGPRVLLPESADAELHDEMRVWSDRRNWRSGVHAGTRNVRIRHLKPRQAAP
jgi:CRISPR system Cascade subunit CasD